MGLINPPMSCPGVPAIFGLRQGAQLVRIHSDTLGPLEFNPNPATDPLKGGRFDSLAPNESFLYAGETYGVAVAEMLLRDVGTTPSPVILPAAKLRGRRISFLKTTVDLSLVDMTTTAALNQLGPGLLLISTEAFEYEQTRKWGERIRQWLPDVAGFVWPSRRLREQHALVLFDYGGRLPVNALRLTSTQRLDAPLPRGWIRSFLLKHNLTVT